MEKLEQKEKVRITVTIEETHSWHKDGRPADKEELLDNVKSALDEYDMRVVCEVTEVGE